MLEIVISSFSWTVFWLMIMFSAFLIFIVFILLPPTTPVPRVFPFFVSIVSMPVPFPILFPLLPWALIFLTLIELATFILSVLVPIRTKSILPICFFPFELAISTPLSFPIFLSLLIWAFIPWNFINLFLILLVFLLKIFNGWLYFLDRWLSWRLNLYH